MPRTTLALELQITQEYLGQAVHLVYLAPMWQEILTSDNYAQGQGSTVASIIDGSLFRNQDSAIIGIANTGSGRTWCGHHFAQANWYAYGRLAWDHRVSSETVCEEWVRMTWPDDFSVQETIKKMMLGSWEACVNYMTPLGLHHIMQEGHHYGPDPAFGSAPRADWNPVYYHQADKAGLGFDRSPSGSNAAGQYLSLRREEFAGLETCPEKYLLWFHHVPWHYRLKSGRTLIDEMEYCYKNGVKYAIRMRYDWEALKGKVDPQRHTHVAKRLQMQESNAREWRDVCIRYFRQFTG
jgi:alpha-glucuronidase